LPRYKKKEEPKYENSIPGLPPPLDEDVPLMIEEEEEEIPEGLVGIFTFDSRIKTPDDINGLFGCNRRIPFVQVDYWKDICKSCNINGEIFYDERVIIYLLNAYINFYVFITLTLFAISL
jgi:hypothetical protein